MPNMHQYGVKQALPYSWYRQHFMANQNLDDAGNSSQPISEQQWNAMDPNQQYGAVQIGSYGVDPNDEVLKGITDRYAAAGNQGRGVMVNDVNKFNGGNVWTDPTTGIRMTNPDNVYKSPDRITPAIGLAAVLGGGMLGNYMLGQGMFGGSGAGALLEGGIPYNPAGYTAAGDAVGSGGLLSGGASAPSLLQGVTPSTVNGSGLLTAPSLSGGASSGGLLSSLGAGDFSGAASSVGNWAMNNPLQALGVGQSIGGLFGRDLLGGGGKPGGSSNPTSTYNSGSKGGSGQFTPNPYTVSQLQRYQRGMGL